MHVSQDLMSPEILKSFWFLGWTKQGLNKMQSKEIILWLKQKDKTVVTDSKTTIHYRKTVLKTALAR